MTLTEPQITDEPWIPLDTWATRLAALRTHMHWASIEDAAQACDINRETWRGWEKEGRKPRDLTGVARQIADATGCSATWLVMGGPLRSRCFLAAVPDLPGQLELALGLEPPALAAV